MSPDTPPATVSPPAHPHPGADGRTPGFVLLLVAILATALAVWMRTAEVGGHWWLAVLFVAVAAGTLLALRVRWPYWLWFIWW